MKLTCFHCGFSSDLNVADGSLFWCPTCHSSKEGRDFLSKIGACICLTEKCTVWQGFYHLPSKTKDKIKSRPGSRLCPQCWSIH